MMNSTVMSLPEGVQDKILEYLGIESAPKEKQEEILAKIGEVAFKEILLATLERLDEEHQKAYNELLEKESTPEEVETFLREAIPDYDEMVSQKVDDLMKGLKDAGDESEK